MAKIYTLPASIDLDRVAAVLLRGVSDELDVTEAQQERRLASARRQAAYVAGFFQALRSHDGLSLELCEQLTRHWWHAALCDCEKCVG